MSEGLRTYETGLQYADCHSIAICLDLQSASYLHILIDRHKDSMLLFHANTYATSA